MLLTDAAGTAAIIVATCSGFATVCGAIASFVVSLQNRNKIDGVRKVVDVVHRLTNSAMTMQIESTAKALQLNALSLGMVYARDQTPENLLLLREAEQMAADAEQRYQRQKEGQDKIAE